MKEVVIISFDLIRQGEINRTYAISSLMAFAKQDPAYGEEFVVRNVCINAFGFPTQFDSKRFQSHIADIDFSKVDTVAISAYVWNEQIINPLILYLRMVGVRNKIVLGGYQVTYGSREQLIEDYPDCDIFISGYAEAALLKAIRTTKSKQKQFISDSVDFSDLPSPYLSGELQVSDHQPMVRVETKRGCPYRCTFCAHRDLNHNKVYRHTLDKVFEELQFLKTKKVQRVNVLDPVFNVGNDFISVLEEIDRLNFTDTIFTLQTRFELIKDGSGQRFLDLVERANAHLEFGIQTVIPEEYQIINRHHNAELIPSLFNELSDRGISYEASLIYGLPGQTLDSFKRSVDFLTSNGCKKVVAFPLMLLKGTELYSQRDAYQMQEEPMGEFDIPVVTSSLSFDKDEWMKMRSVAEHLGEVERV